MEVSQLAYDIISYCLVGFVFIPFLLGLIALCVFCVVYTIKSEALRNEYLSRLSKDDRHVISEYFDNTNLFVYLRRLRRIKKNLNTNNKEE